MDSTLSVVLRRNILLCFKDGKVRLGVKNSFFAIEIEKALSIPFNQIPVSIRRSDYIQKEVCRMRLEGIL